MHLKDVVVGEAVFASAPGTEGFYLIFLAFPFGIRVPLSFNNYNSYNLTFWTLDDLWPHHPHQLTSGITQESFVLRLNKIDVKKFFGSENKFRIFTMIAANTTSGYPVFEEDDIRDLLLSGDGKKNEK